MLFQAKGSLVPARPNVVRGSLGNVVDVVDLLDSKPEQTLGSENNFAVVKRLPNIKIGNDERLVRDRALPSL
jgi:hypothetical protein